MTVLRVGVIGTGFGRQVHIPAFAAHPRAKVVAVASATPGKAAKVAAEFNIPHPFDDWQDLVRDELDLVSITPQPVTHRVMAVTAAEAGRHLLCEKPMALDVQEAQEMLGAAERAGVVHVIDHELRFNPNRRKIKALIDDGFVGRPRHALITVIGSGRSNPDRPWDWWADRSQGGGLLGAQGSHQIDLLRYWLGDVETVSGGTESFIKERPLDGRLRRVTSDDFTAFALRFRSGAVATVILSVVAAHAEGPRIEMWGEDGSLRLDGRERLWGARRGEEWRELTDPETVEAPPGMDYAPLWGLSFVRIADHLVRAILDGAALEPAATFADGLAVQRVMDTVREAGRSWREV
jgi:predicted dehydrogenase